MTKKKRFTIIAVAFVIINLILVLVSRIVFLNINIYKSVYGVIAVSIDEEKIISITKKAGTYIIDDNMNITDFFEKEGFTELEDRRTGSMRFVTDGDNTYSVTCVRTKLYTALRFEKEYKG